jgi:hypothetical protein
MYVNGEIINDALNFIIRLEISSYLHLFLVLNDLIIFSISLVEAHCHLILVKGLLKLFHKLVTELVALYLYAL